jgi:RimJ/RimL family protein N-acetyltransferase
MQAAEAIAGASGYEGVDHPHPEEALIWRKEGQVVELYFHAVNAAGDVVGRGRWDNWPVPEGSLGDDVRELEGVTSPVVSAACVLRTKQEYERYTGVRQRDKDQADVLVLQRLLAGGRTLMTPRLLLRPMRAEDVADLLAVFGDPKVMASFDSPPFDREMMDGWVAENLDHLARYGYGLFSVVLRESGMLIGDCGLEHMEVEGRPEVELGYDLRSDYWNRGLASEAAAAVRDFAFRELMLPRLISLIRISNAASMRVAEKIGMRPERELTRYGNRYWLYVIHPK